MLAWISLLHDAFLHQRVHLSIWVSSHSVTESGSECDASACRRGYTSTARWCIIIKLFCMITRFELDIDRRHKKRLSLSLSLTLYYSRKVTHVQYTMRFRTWYNFFFRQGNVNVSQEYTWRFSKLCHFSSCCFSQPDKAFRQNAVLIVCGLIVFVKKMLFFFKRSRSTMTERH